MTTFQDWREPARLLVEQCGAPTKKQLALARSYNVRLAGVEPRCVAGRLIYETLEAVIWGTDLPDPPVATSRQRSFLASLGESGIASFPRLSKGVASTWIDHLLKLRTAARLHELKLKKGDHVIMSRFIRSAFNPHVEQEQDWKIVTRHVVSSIGANGMVYFKGGNGSCGWPQAIRRPESDDDENEYAVVRVVDPVVLVST